MTIFKYALRRGFFAPMALWFNCALPLILMVVMRGEGLGDRGPFLLAMAVMFGGFFMAKGVQADRAEGVLLRILCGPVTMRDYLFQNLLASAIPVIGLSFLIGAFGFVLHDWTFTFAIGLTLCYAFLAVTSVGLSFVWSTIFTSRESSSGAFAAAMTLVAMISGFFVPLHMMPDVLFYMGALFPAHWASRGIQEMLNYGAFTSLYWLSLLVMTLFAVIFILIGAKKRLI